MSSSNKLHLWECALLMAFALFLLSGVWAGSSQSALADKVVRLHVIANSDSEADQALKLRVRDAVLTAAGNCLSGVTDRQEAERILSDRLSLLSEAGAAAVAAQGYDYPVSVSLERCWFPTKYYATFSLPAGSYHALRVVVGEGAGQNWWCVVFPPLCLGTVCETVEEAAALSGLSDDEISLITGGDGRYVLKFKLVEWWNRLFRRSAWQLPQTRKTCLSG